MRLKTRYQRAIQLLKDMEWCGLHTDDEDWSTITIACPCCCNAKSDGHKSGCQLAELIEE